MSLLPHFNSKMRRLYTYIFTLISFFGMTVIAYTAEPPENILKNADFENKLDQWHHWTHENAAALFQTEGNKAEPIVGKNVAYVKINKAGDAPWHIQLYQQPFILEKDNTYTYSLWGKSEKPRNARMRIIHQGEPWTEYAVQQISLSETWKESFMTFKMPVDDVNSRAGLILGGEKVDVWFDHIRVYEGKYVADIEGAEPHEVQPKDKLATTWASLKNQD